MKSKEELKKVFENGDKPKQEDFWDLIESYFHRDEPISLEELSLLKSNLATVDKTNDGTEISGNVDTKEQVNAKINFAINALKANAPETYDTLKEIADYIANDSNAETALLQLINTKLDKPIMTNNYYGLWDDTNKRFVNGNIQTQNSKTIIGYNFPVSDVSNATLRLGLPNPTLNIPLNVGSNWSNSPYTVKGDVWVNKNRLYYKDQEDWVYKLGLDIEAILGSEQNVNTAFDLKSHGSKNLGRASLMQVDNTNGNKISTWYPNATNIHPDMYGGLILSAEGYRVASYIYFDNQGGIFGSGSGFPWKKYIGEITNTTTILSEKINATKGVVTKDLSFTLQTSITPTPNTLVPETDGSNLIWFTNSSVGVKIANKLEPIIVNSNTTLSAIHDEKALIVTANCTITFPTALRVGFNCVIIVKGNFTVQFIQGSGATIYAPQGLYLKQDSSASLISDVMNGCIIKGELETT